MSAYTWREQLRAVKSALISQPIESVRGPQTFHIQSVGFHATPLAYSDEKRTVGAFCPGGGPPKGYTSPTSHACDSARTFGVRSRI